MSDWVSAPDSIRLSVKILRYQHRRCVAEPSVAPILADLRKPALDPTMNRNQPASTGVGMPSKFLRMGQI